MTELQIKRKKRKKITAEDFTPEYFVNKMLDNLPDEIWEDSSKTFLDNSAGNGNMLICVLARKLSHNHDPLQALSTIYGVELMPDNVEEMRGRMLQVLLEHCPDLDNTQITEAKKILDYNIVCYDALAWDYDNWKAPANLKPKALF